MLCLSCKIGKSVYLDLGDGRVVEIKAIEFRQDKVLLGIAADEPSIAIYRDKICPPSVAARAGEGFSKDGPTTE